MTNQTKSSDFFVNYCVLAVARGDGRGRFREKGGHLFLPPHPPTALPRQCYKHTLVHKKSLASLYMFFNHLFPCAVVMAISPSPSGTFFRILSIKRELFGKKRKQKNSFTALFCNQTNEWFFFVAGKWYQVVLKTLNKVRLPKTNRFLHH